MSATATKVRVYAHREADGHLILLSTVPPLPFDMEEGDVVTEFDIWMPDLTEGSST